jgi:RHS repeat-associated protein
VNSITIGGTTYTADASTAYTAYACNRTDGGWQGVLACSGDMLMSHIPTAGQVVTVNAWGSPDYSVYPHMQVFVNGTLLGEWDVTGSAQNYSVTAGAPNFSSTSFPSSASGSTLAGGADSYQYPTTPYSVALTFMPNGNVATANDNVNGNWTYGYDDFNRLASASQSGQAFTYDYDRYGNRWHQNVTAGSGPAPMFSFTSGNNRLDGYSYDAAGNVLNDNNGHGFLYDAENRIIQVNSNVFYVYDGEGRRIRKTVGGSTVDYFYDLESHEIAEMNSGGGWNRGEVFAGNWHLATYFVHADWLGTERSRTAVDGTRCQTSASLPYGDGVSSTGSCAPSPNFFTGKGRDAETGNDYFGARYYSAAAGRWMSPDWSRDPLPIPYSNKRQPQTLNLYRYAGNNPLAEYDLDGHNIFTDFFGNVGERTSNLLHGRGFRTNAQLKMVRALVTVEETYRISPAQQKISANNAAIAMASAVIIAQAISDSVSDGAASEELEETIVTKEEQIASLEAENVELEAEVEAEEAADASTAQYKRLTKGEIKILEEHDIDPHDLKPNSKFDLFKSPTGEIVVKPKGGQGPGDPTGININDLKKGS